MVHVVSDGEIGFPMERCCFCRNPTKHWVTDALGGEVTGLSVACCLLCAKHANYEDLPTKKQWFRRERIVDAGLSK